MTTNFNSLGICAMGNYQEAQMGYAQQRAIEDLLAELLIEFELDTYYIIRHKDVIDTQCPGQYYPYYEIRKGVEMK